MNDIDETAPVGRPTKYRPEMADQAEKLCRLGATDAEIADFFDVSERTINNWKADHPEFLQSIKRGKIQADAEVADRLFQRACGYSHGDEKIFVSEGQVVRAATVKHYAPDSTACIFWLKNRRPAQWRDKVEVQAEERPWTPPRIEINWVEPAPGQLMEDGRWVTEGEARVTGTTVIELTDGQRSITKD